MHLYHVRPGDTVPSISRRFRVTPEMLLRRNNLSPSPCLLPGQCLLIPSRLELSGSDHYLTYLAQEGDTPRSLAERWRLPLTWLSFCNGWTEPALSPGDVVLLPAPEHRELSPHAQLKPCLRLASLQRGLRTDAAGCLHEPHAWSTGLITLELDGAPGILPDVAKAILHSEQAGHRLLDSLAVTLRENGGEGVVFDWQALPRSQVALYLDLVREAGRRLRPMGVTVGLYLTADSPAWKRPQELLAAVEHLDAVFCDPAVESPAETGLCWQDEEPPAPLISLSRATRCLEEAREVLPPEKCWLVTHAVAVRLRRGQAKELFCAQDALSLARQTGSPLQRDAQSALAWYRERGGEEGGTVWLEDLWSIVRKARELESSHWQGLALWELGAHLPDVWDYMRDQYEVKD
ncbi:LysM peptidoglycan-binding domain-containing protein [Tumebacillus sp. DT12]|uniref:LysM peptidoglycan-binding domain-containing protein n=1 Tax=Tumebacillus lacus TaxID=2995335 RepID=A0ABT3X1M1_9BACL|nr:LysM peptidoglycan-binding domain-containing protein [Tumebacillus lacus]MCX7570341.1 LysM peptidoglycan-binding domain-containing protein [Tumebacillus lacus]